MRVSLVVFFEPVRKISSRQSKLWDNVFQSARISAFFE